MPSRRSREEEELPDPDPEEDEDPEPAPPRRPHPRSRPSPRRPGPFSPEPLTDWSKSQEGAPSKGGRSRAPRKPVYWRARDSLWFEPLVALAIIVLLIVGLYAYTSNWPPVYVVESMSMQHGTNDHVGLINTGDLVLAQKVAPSSIVPYMVGLQTGFSTYGEYGDVLLYYPGGDTAVTPIIHRAIVYLEFNPDGTWNIPELAPLTCTATDHPYYAVSTPTGCGTTQLIGQVTLYDIGWQGVTVTIPLESLEGHSGFLTMGDNNYIPGHPGQGEPDQTAGISEDALVPYAWILGVARGMIPWFGSIKLWLEGDASMVPSQSWDYLATTLAAIVLGGLGLHLALRREEDPPEEEPTEEEGVLDPAEKPHRPRRRTRGEEDDDSEPPTRTHRRPAHHRPIPKEQLLRSAHKRGGRPVPSVRRSKSHPRSDRSKDPDQAP